MFKLLAQSVKSHIKTADRKWPQCSGTHTVLLLNGFMLDICRLSQNVVFISECLYIDFYYHCQLYYYYFYSPLKTRCTKCFLEKKTLFFFGLGRPRKRGKQNGKHKDEKGNDYRVGNNSSRRKEKITSRQVCKSHFKEFERALISSASLKEETPLVLSPEQK